MWLNFGFRNADFVFEVHPKITQIARMSKLAADSRGYTQIGKASIKFFVHFGSESVLIRAHPRLN